MPKIFTIALLLLICGRANAQYDFKKVDTWLADNASEMGGRTILMVYKNGQVVYTHAVNQLSARQKMVNKFIARRQGKNADLDDYTPATRQPVASCSKWYSAALVMTFVDQGQLKLTDTVGKYLPVLTQHGKGNITIGQCLSHLTGIKAPPLKENLSEMKAFNTMDEVIENIAAMPMEGEPGKTFHYSNVGMQIAGSVLEKISGKSFETLFAERITQPLHMTNTDFGKGKIAQPAAGAFSTPDDYLKFLAMILNKGTLNNTRILSENSVALMQVNRQTKDVKIAYAPEEAGDFGYGYGEWTLGNNTVSSPGLFGSFPWVSNDKQYAGFMMTLYIKTTGRHERYVTLMKLVDDALAGK
ncbi:serine hydrolase domain-containing protein [Mucilaginibacter sp.]|uniref:serine hydrolase domain-containing protein n=1 Tax=Mucilaginibacter sp. TaxID=1882438 RepID=UPI003D1113AF